MEEKNTTPEITELDDINATKKGNFWDWMRLSEQSEGGHSINLDKRIPGFASIIAIILFLIKEYIHRESDEGHFFTDSKFTLSLQVLNIVVLLIILIRGLRIAIVDPEYSKVYSDKINFRYIEILERQFIGFIKYFFGMSLCLYMVLSMGSLLTENGDQFSARHQYLNDIKAAHAEIVNDGQLLSDSIDKSDAVLKTLNPQIDSIRSIANGMPVDKTLKSDDRVVTIQNLKEIRKRNKLIRNLIIEIDEHANSNEKLKVKPAYLNSAIDRIYHGSNIIEFRSQISDEEATFISLINIAKVTFSNMGGFSWFTHFWCYMQKLRSEEKMITKNRYCHSNTFLTHTSMTRIERPFPSYVLYF